MRAAQRHRGRWLPLAYTLACLAGCQNARGGSAGSIFALERADDAAPSTAGAAIAPTLAGQPARLPPPLPSLAPLPTATASVLTPDAVAVGRVPAAVARGQVFEAGSDRPLGGATVWTNDGRSAVSEADGRFAIPGTPPVDGSYLAALAGYVASAVSGLAADDPVALHLQPRTRTVAERVPGPRDRFLARGRLVDPLGQPLAGMVVVLQDARGSFSAPGLTDASGAFAVETFGIGQTLVNGTLLATGSSGVHFVALATGARASAAAPDLVFPAGVATPAGAIQAVAATHPLALAIDATALGVTPRLALDLVAADGTRLGLPDVPQAPYVAALPGARYALRAEASDSARGLQAVVYRDALAIDFQSANTTIGDRFLAAPDVAPPGGPVGGFFCQWAPVAEARGYHVVLAGLDNQGWLWEGYTPRTSLPVSYQGPLAAGRYGLAVEAWDAPGLGPRGVAMAGARALRLPAMVGGDYRYTAHQQIFSQPAN